MKVRVIERDGWYYSQYYDEFVRIPHWDGTFRNNDFVEQNRFKNIEDAIAECKWFAENKSNGKVVWKDEL